MPNCTLIECERPPINTGVYILPDKSVYLYSEFVTFECYAGFTLTGSTKVECQEFGWSDLLPSCLLVDCGLVPAISHSLVFYVAGTTYQQEAHIYCEPGYNLTGSHTVVCDSTASWTPGVPTCNVIGTAIMVFWQV